MVARLTPDQKAACSTHVGVIRVCHFFSVMKHSKYFITVNTTLKFRFCSVVVITCASHAQGPRFEPEQNHVVRFAI